MTFNRTILLLTVLFFCGCSKPTEKDVLKGDRISIITQEESIIPDILLKNKKVILPKQLNYTDWVQTRAFADNAPLHISLSKTVHEYWNESVGASLSSTQSYLSSPIVFNDVLYSLNIKNEIVALDADSGEELWDLKLDSELTRNQKTTAGSLAIDGKLLIATLTSGEIYAINIVNQKIEWQKKLSQVVRSASVIKDGTLFIKSINDKLFAFNVVNGELIWSHTGVHQIFSVMNNSRPAVSKNVVVVTYNNNDVFALDALSGNELWTISLNPILSFKISKDKTSSSTSPVIIGDHVFVASNNGDLTVINLLSGLKVWSQPVKVKGNIWIAGNSSFFITKLGQLVCILNRTSKVKWVVDLKQFMLKDLDTKNKEDATFTSPVLAGNRLFIASNKGYIGTFNPKTGQILRLINSKENISAEPIIVNKTLYFLTNRSHIIAYK
ncbi:MAG: PQQ-binding-like beta-propeller repeat protein [Proteobacteria bacterium]|nr:PQQ-binding-like beta-propeller repeat protein [Pseudomonadota bacterium]